jgi:hypothetical protein
MIENKPLFTLFTVVMILGMVFVEVGISYNNLYLIVASGFITTISAIMVGLMLKGRSH